MPDEDQITIFSNKELEFLNKMLSGNDKLVYAIRKVLLQFNLTDSDKETLKQVTPELIRVMKKRILAEPSNEFPFGQIPLFYSTLSEAFKSKIAEDMEKEFDAKELEIAYIEQQLAVLADLDAQQPIKQPIKLSEMPTMSDRYIGITAYTFLFWYLDQMLYTIKILSGKKGETPEDMKKRLSRDSNK